MRRHQNQSQKFCNRRQRHEKQKHHELVPVRDGEDAADGQKHQKDHEPRELLAPEEQREEKKRRQPNELHLD